MQYNSICSIRFPPLPHTEDSLQEILLIAPLYFNYIKRVEYRLGDSCTILTDIFFERRFTSSEWEPSLRNALHIITDFSHLEFRVGKTVCATQLWKILAIYHAWRDPIPISQKSRIGLVRKCLTEGIKQPPFAIGINMNGKVVKKLISDERRCFFRPHLRKSIAIAAAIEVFAHFFL